MNESTMITLPLKPSSELNDYIFKLNRTINSQDRELQTLRLKVLNLEDKIALLNNKDCPMCKLREQVIDRDIEIRNLNEFIDSHF